MIKEIAAYWDKQSAIWSEEKEEAWNKPETTYWKDYFTALLPTLPGNKVLEVGTASGYFANILSLAGYEVTAVDVSSAMIAEAKAVSAALDCKVDYYVMDGQELDFSPNSFDLIFTRLMTWTIPNVGNCYQSFFRVLKPGGKVLNFDGDFGKCLFSNEGHEKYPTEIMEEANTIKSKLDISKQNRPDADITLLKAAGFVNVSADHTTQKEILRTSTAELFLVQGLKPL